jgi:hypothetical protein
VLKSRLPAAAALFAALAAALFAALAAALLAALPLVLVSTAPAHAAVPDAYAFVTAGSSGNVDPSKTWPPGTTVTQPQFGYYEITFPGQAAKGGVVHVVPINDGPWWCQPVKWAPSGADEVVVIMCSELGGLLSNVPFTATFAGSSGPPSSAGRYAYVESDASGAIVTEYNSSGAPNSVTTTGGGLYNVTLPGLGAGRYEGGVQATATGPVSARCKVRKWGFDPSAQFIVVSCFDALGNPAKVGFTLTYQYQQALFGGAYPPKYFGYDWYLSTGSGPVYPETNFNSVTGVGVNTVSQIATGMYEVTFPNLALTPDDIQVTAYGATASWCQLLQFWKTGNDTVASVACFAAIGGFVDSAFFVSANAAF